MYSATSDNMKSVHRQMSTPADDGWAVTFGTAMRGQASPSRSPPAVPNVTALSPSPINGQCTNHCIAVQRSVALRF